MIGPLTRYGEGSACNEGAALSSEPSNWSNVDCWQDEAKAKLAEIIIEWQKPGQHSKGEAHEIHTYDPATNRQAEVAVAAGRLRAVVAAAGTAENLAGVAGVEAGPVAAAAGVGTAAAATAARTALLVAGMVRRRDMAVRRGHGVGLAFRAGVQQTLQPGRG